MQDYLKTQEDNTESSGTGEKKSKLITSEEMLNIGMAWDSLLTAEE